MIDRPELSAEDAKLVTLARGARSRIGASEGAALRDETGRTFTGVSIPVLGLSAVALAVANARAAGSASIEAVVLLGAADLPTRDLDIVRDLGGSGVTIHIAASDATVHDTLTT